MKFQVNQSLLNLKINSFKEVEIAILQLFTLALLICDLNLDLISQILLVCLHLFHGKTKMVPLGAMNILSLRDFHTATFVQVLLKTSEVRNES